jgi:hypothetical protein
MGTPYDLGNPENYTIGGLRFFFDEIVSNVNQGYIYLGNVVTGGLTPTLDKLAHFTAKSGKRLKDREIVRETSMAFNFTLDEPNVVGMNLFMLGGEISAQAAAPAQAVASMPAIIRDADPVFIPHKNPTAIVVTDAGGVTTLVLNTDYTLGTTLGYTYIKRVPTSVDIADGDVIEIDYTYARPAARTFNPATRTVREGRALIQGVSDIGNEFEYEIARASLTPNGDFTFNDQDWSQFEFSLEILDNTANDVNAPFGKVIHHGIGQDI